MERKLEFDIDGATVYVRVESGVHTEWIYLYATLGDKESNKTIHNAGEPFDNDLLYLEAERAVQELKQK